MENENTKRNTLFNEIETIIINGFKTAFGSDANLREHDVSLRLKVVPGDERVLAEVRLRKPAARLKRKRLRFTKI